MNNWLDKYEQGGMVLKQKTKDNYGKKANPNNPDVSLPPGFKGLAYNTKGRNYSPAWGGQFQMGGSLPGAVGFTYARTVGAAPSNGPYAKKTKASAQNGKEMKYYQAGLDFKPKNISQDGSEIPNAQLGTHMLPIDASKAAENFFELLSVPQKAITALFSGKYQTPSEAMGIKNTAGAIATDMVLDPVNLIGAGAVGKVGKAAKAAVKASTETGALSKAYKYNPWAFKANPEAYYRQVGKDAIDDALSTKLIRERGEVVSPESFENFNRQITDLHGQGDYVDYYEKMKAQTLAKEHGPMPYFMKGELFFDDKSVMKGGAKSKGVSQGKKTKADHLIESNHPSEAFQNSFAYKFSPGNVEEVGGIGVLKPNPSLRDLENFNLYKQHWLKGYKEVKPSKKKEDGGDIKKDDNGYWNPENWGEPVEIGSNEITMQGVYEPLLGISDTGDTQMMYPGEDYEFDGDYVTEIPVMQKGGRTPIYTENPKDKRIKAYQDSLSLYNQTLGNLKAFKKDLGWQHDDATLRSSIRKYWPNAIAHMKASSKATEWYASDEENNDPTGTRESTYSTSGYKNKVIPTILPVDYYAPQWSDNAFSRIPRYKKPVQPVVYKKPQPKQEVVKKQEATQPPVRKEQPKPIERKQNVYEGSPVYSPGAGIGMGSALVGFLGQKGDTTYIKPEDYERFAVPKYGKQFIESKKKQRNGGVNKADEYPIEKLDQSLNFTNYNKPTKGGWLDKYN